MNFKKLSLLFLIGIQQLNFSQNTSENVKKTCISQQERDYILQTLHGNKKIIEKTESVSKNTKHPLFIWPLKGTKNAEKYHSIWGVSNFVDQDPLNNVVNPKTNKITESHYKDYNGGFRTYDGHHGTDIYITPFWWKMVENEVAQVVAAAPGKIIGKQDGNYDRNCEWNPNNRWNAIFLEHADGSTTWYGHMKNGSLTEKKIGDFVKEGEYLGIVASSGISNGPHLHFEVYDKNNNLIDPFKGKFNKLNKDSWWKKQLPARLPGIFSVTISDDFVDWNDRDTKGYFVCGNIEITNEKEVFHKNEFIIFTFYFRDPVNEDLLKNIKVYKPDNTLAVDWTDADKSLWSDANGNEIMYNNGYGKKSDFYNSYNTTLELVTVLDSKLVDMNGKWRIEVQFGDDYLVKTFNVDSNLSINDIFTTKNNTKVYPNPTKGTIYFKTNTKIKSVTIRNVLGEIVFQSEKENINSVNTSSLSSGIYFITIKNNKNSNKTIKLLKK